MNKFYPYIFILLTAFISTPLNISGQSMDKKRVEFDVNENFTNHTIEHFGENGVLVSTVRQTKKNTGYTYKFEKYATTLELVDSVLIDIPKEYFIQSSCKNDSTWHLLFSNKKGESFIYSISAFNLNHKKIDLNLPLNPKFYVNNTITVGNGFFISGTLKKGSVFYHVNLTTGKTTFATLKYREYKPKQIHIINEQVIENTDEIVFFIKITVSKKVSELIAIRFNQNCQQMGIHNVSQAANKNLVSISATVVNSNEYLYTGTYSGSTTTMSEGVFITKFINNERVFINYYNFLDFSDFLKYLPQKNIQKIITKKSKLEDRGKEYSLNFNIAQHNIIEVNNTYILIGEAFYPTYRTEMYTTFINGQPVMTTRQVFDGYQYSHAFISCFDKNGQKLWDNSFELWSAYKPYYVKQFIATQTSDKINLMYLSREKIVAKSIDFNGKTLVSKDIGVLKTGNENDDIKWTQSDLKHWYGKSFVAFGTQKIKNTDEKKKKKEVFFINKITVK